MVLHPRCDQERGAAGGGESFTIIMKPPKTARRCVQCNAEFMARYKKFVTCGAHQCVVARLLSRGKHCADRRRNINPVKWNTAKRESYHIRCAVKWIVRQEVEALVPA